MKLCYRLILVFILVFSVGVVTWAADDDSVFSDDSLFSDDSMTETITNSAPQNETKALDEKLHIGGDFSFALTPTWTYQNNGLLLKETLGTALNGRLYFDARPDQDSRFFGKVRVSYPFVLTTKVPNINTPDLNDSIATVETINLQIQELFSDFNYKDKIFFRAGKQTIKWGVGYFFSPADVLNLAPIDPGDPEAEREGPVSLKVNYPFGENNFYGYLIAKNAQKPGDLALAVKSEYLIGNLELGVGGFYRPELAPRAVLMATLPTSTVDFFVEAVLSKGSDKNFLESTNDLVNYPLGVKPVQKKDELFPSVTVGCNFMSDKASAFCQYFYNGEGYSDLSLLRRYQSGIIFNHSYILPEIGLNDLMQPGKHYVAVSTSLLKLFNNADLSLSLFGIENLSDYSALITPKFSWKIINKATLSLSAPCSFGEQGTEFAPFGNTRSVSLSLNLGSGSF